MAGQTVYEHLLITVKLRASAGLATRARRDRVVLTADFIVDQSKQERSVKNK